MSRQPHDTDEDLPAPVEDLPAPVEDLPAPKRAAVANLPAPKVPSPTVPPASEEARLPGTRAFREAVTAPELSAPVPTDEPREPVFDGSAATPTSVVDLPAPVEDLLAPVDNSLAPVDNLPAPVDNLPAPVDNLPAPVDNLPAPVDNLPAPRRATIDLRANLPGLDQLTGEPDPLPLAAPPPPADLPDRRGPGAAPAPALTAPPPTEGRAVPGRSIALALVGLVVVAGGAIYLASRSGRPVPVAVEPPRPAPAPPAIRESPTTPPPTTQPPATPPIAPTAPDPAASGPRPAAIGDDLVATARAQLASANFPAAKDAAASAVRQQGTAAAYVVLGQVLEAGNKPREARKRYQEALRRIAAATQPVDEATRYEARLGEVRALLKSDVVGDAEARAAALAQEFPRRVEPLLLLGDSQARRGEMDAALGTFKTAVETPPRNPEALYKLARELHGGNQDAAAAQRIDEALEAGVAHTAFKDEACRLAQTLHEVHKGPGKAGWRDGRCD